MRQKPQPEYVCARSTVIQNDLNRKFSSRAHYLNKKSYISVPSAKSKVTPMSKNTANVTLVTISMLWLLRKFEYQIDAS